METLSEERSTPGVIQISKSEVGWRVARERESKGAKLLEVIAKRERTPLEPRAIPRGSSLLQVWGAGLIR